MEHEVICLALNTTPLKRSNAQLLQRTTVECALSQRAVPVEMLSCSKLWKSFMNGVVDGLEEARQIYHGLEVAVDEAKTVTPMNICMAYLMDVMQM